MAKGKRVRMEDVKKFLEQGQTMEEIARAIGTTVTKVKRHKYRLIKTRKYLPKSIGMQLTFESLDQATNFWIERLQESKKVPVLEEEINRLKNINATLRNELDLCNEKLSSTSKKEKEYKLALQQGDVAEPILSNN